MSKNYTSPEDFAADESFIRYCFKDNDKDMAFWDEWLSRHPEQHENARKAEKLLHILTAKTDPDKKLKNWNILKEEQLSKNVKNASPAIPDKRKVRFKRFRVAAAIVLLILGGGAVFLLTDHKKEGQFFTYETVSGEKREVVLPDETRVWLNADSKIIYNKNFEHSGKREVTLTGEAYFKVQKAHNFPFIIHANALNIEVLGTELNVRAYSQALTTSTTLIRGAVQLYFADDPNHKIRLKPKEKFTYSNRKEGQPEAGKPEKIVRPALPGLPEYKISKIHPDPLLDDEIVETAWLRGKLVFRDEDFGSLALQMGHRYGVQFNFDNADLKNYRYTGIFTGETLDEALHALQLTSPSHPFKYRIEGKTVYITP